MIDYKKIKENSICEIHNLLDSYDINVLIPVRGRIEFAAPMYKSFLAAKNNSPLKIKYTVIEHSCNSDHYEFCKLNKLNYIWIKCEPIDQFNKCLCFNMGAIYSNISKYIICHDLDCLMQSDFFIKLMQNINIKNCNAIQCFHSRRVIYCDEILTSYIINNEINIDSVNVYTPNTFLPESNGAPGGSICVTRKLFFDVGGFDEHLFVGYSHEDAYFWEKIDTIDNMTTCNNPPIDLFHLHHVKSVGTNIHYNSMNVIYDLFKNSDLNTKLQIIQTKRMHIKQYSE
jgi:hypothetical protein